MFWFQFCFCVLVAKRPTTVTSHHKFWHRSFGSRNYRHIFKPYCTLTSALPNISTVGISGKFLPDRDNERVTFQHVSRCTGEVQTLVFLVAKMLRHVWQFSKGFPLSQPISHLLSDSFATLQLSSDWEQWLTKLQEWEWGCVKARGFTTGEKIPKPGSWPLFYVATLNIPAITHVWSCEVNLKSASQTESMHGHQNMIFHHRFMTKRK